MSPAPTPRRSPATLRRQILLRGLLLTGAALLLLALSTVAYEVANRRADLVADGRTLARLVATNSEAAMRFDSQDEAAELLASLTASPNIVQARLFRSNGQPLASFEGRSAETPCHTLGPTGPREVVSWCGIGLSEPVDHRGQRVGMLALEVSMQPVHEALVRATFFSALVGLVAFGISVPLWRRLADRLTRPLQQLVDLTVQVGIHNDFSCRSRAGGSAEVAALAAAFNGMLTQLEQRDEQLHHELQQRRAAEQRLSELAYRDNVTGLRNRHFFMEGIDRALLEAETPQRSGSEAGGVLAFLDLDGFKLINDTLGHDRGDELLRQVGLRLTHALRSSDIVCRLGGDEFAVILLDIGPATPLDAIARKMLEAIARPYDLGGHPGRVSASMGLCRFPGTAGDRETLMRYADSAMYRAKESGKNRYCVHGEPCQTPAPPETSAPRAAGSNVMLLNYSGDVPDRRLSRHRTPQGADTGT